MAGGNSPTNGNPLIRSNQVIQRRPYLPLPSGAGFEQEIIIDDDLTFTIAGQRESKGRYYIYLLLSILTGGLFALFVKWNPKVQLWLKATPARIDEADLLTVTNQWGEMTLVKVDRIPLNSLPFQKLFPRQEHEQVLSSVSSFEYRYFVFFLNPWTGQYEPNYAWRDPAWVNVLSVLKSTTDIASKELIFGRNQIDIKQRSDLQILLDEILHPFFVFQIASIILWSLDSYYYYAICIFLITVVSTSITFLDIKENIKRMQGLAKFSCMVDVWINDSWQTIPSEDLVPGHVFQFKSGDMELFPCDAVLLTGDCIVNESMLTGESLPVSKIPIPDSELASLDFEAEEPSSSAHMSKYFLFSGTKIIRGRGGPVPAGSIIRPKSGCALALVVRTGFNTAKGSLIRSMLFPKPNTFKFYRDSFRFIGMLSIISVLGFMASLYNFVKMHISWKVIIVRALDLITIAVPPALPATMAIGTTFAISRLRKLYIYCTSPPRVNIGGKINMMCFDKTGTLTEEGLDVLGVRFTVAQNSTFEIPEEPSGFVPLRFSRLYVNIHSLIATPLAVEKYTQRPFDTLKSNVSGISLFESRTSGNPNSEMDYPYPLIVCAMACCHSIKVVMGELIGDPLDLKMFQFINWNIDEDTANSALFAHHKIPTLMNVRPLWVPSIDTVKAETLPSDEVHTELGVLKSFEFVSQLRRMSVIVYRFKYSNSLQTEVIMEDENGLFDFDIFVKGAPEVMKSICVPSSSNYLINPVPNDYSELLRGYTHHGYRVIAVAWKKLEQVSVLGASEIPRDQIEKDLYFLGFVVFENKLKPGTTSVIKTLNEASIRQVMCTGDNVLTSISVSRECEIVRPTERVFVPRFIRGKSHEEDAQIIWEDVDFPEVTLDSTTFKPNVNGVGDYVMAITGDAFQWILDFGTDECFQRMLVKTQIFARMAPDQKQFLVQNLQAIGYIVGFCGDGTNDCGALKAADIGLSLSEAEASVAAPFTSNDKDLRCVLNVIREGRAALVTSFCCFKYMALYSLIQFISVSLLYSLAQNIGDFQFMYIDLCLIIPIAVFMGQTGPHSSIHRKRPTASLVSTKVLCSIIGQVILSFVFQYYAFIWVRSQPWYKPGKSDIDNQTYESFENSIVFLTSCYQYLTMAVVFTVGPPYQASIWKNLPLIFTLFTITGFTFYLTLSPPVLALKLFRMMVFPTEGKIFILILAFLNFFISWLNERWIFPLIAKAIGNISDRLYLHRSGGGGSLISSIRKAKIHRWTISGKLFKVIEEEFKSNH